MGDHPDSVTVSLPLDSEGFLRRECPTCEREFKWSHSPEGEGVPASDSGYFCPYCAVQSQPGSWFTKAQAEYITAAGAHEFLGPALEDMRRSFEGINRPDSMIKVSLKTSVPDTPEPLSEDDDMRQVEFECHPTEPVKVLDGWERNVHCLICGEPASGAAG
ncbi:MAG: hypothetical protein JWN81_375 [Solirubrobacterales bacterium]|nr:hypothetical protein [Solirubrobacterales bacterium]